MFVAVGTGFAYGVLLPSLTRDLQLDGGTASGVFAVTLMVFFLAGAPAGVLSDRIGPRTVLLTGSAAFAAGLAVTSVAENVGLVYLGHGVLLGVGMATTFVPLTAVVGASFGANRSLAVGIAVSGIGVGTLVMSPFIAQLIAWWSWRPTYQVLAVVGGLVLTACAVLLPSQTRLGSAPSHEHPLSGLLRTSDFRTLYAAQLILAIVLFIPFAQLPVYAERAGISPISAAALVGVVGAASVAGRVALGVLATSIGSLFTYQACFLMVGLSFTLWLWSGGAYLPLALFAVLFGLGYGGFVALLPAVVAERFGVQRLGGLTGILYTSNAIGAGMGTLGAGLLVSEYSYGPVLAGGVICGLLGALLLTRVSAWPQSA